MIAVRYFKKHAAFAVALFFAALLLAGLLVTGDYGLPCDEPAEQVILRQNMAEYAARLLGANSNASLYYQAQGLAGIALSVERDHGEAAYYLAAPLLQLADTQPDLMTTLWHVYTWLWFMAGVFALYSLMRTFGLNRALACASALLLYLSPRFFAEGHYNNKDVVLLALTLCTLASGARFLKKPTFPRALLFSLAGALTANTKIIGALPWGLIGLAMLISLAARRQLTRRNVIIGLTAIFSFGLFYAALTPAMWAGPLSFVRYLISNATDFSRWSGLVFYQGVLFDPTRGFPLPRTYLPTMIIITTPIAFLVLAAVGQVRAALLCVKKSDHRPLLVVLTVLWLLPMAYAVFARPLMYNGWRHFYFLYAPIAALGGLGLQWLWQTLCKSRVRKALGASALAAVFLWQGVSISLNHPYQFAYYNVLAGDVSSHYELDYWDVSTIDAMKRLCETDARNQSLPLTLSGRDYMSLFGVTHGYAVMPAELRQKLSISKDTDAPYLFYNATYQIIYGVNPPEGYHKLFSLSAYGNVLCTVYEKETVAP